MDYFLGWLRVENCQVTFLPRYVAYYQTFYKANFLTDFSLPPPLLVAPPANELTIHRLLYRALTAERKSQRNTRGCPGVEAILIVEAVLDDNVATEPGRFEIRLNPAPGSNTICRYGHEASVDILCPDR